MSENKAHQRHQIIADFIESISDDFDAKLWLLVKMKQNPNSTISELLGVSCSTIMKKGYSFDDLEGIIFGMVTEQLIEMTQ
jgi:hypothetical protein